MPAGWMQGSALTAVDGARAPGCVRHRPAPAAGPLFHRGDRAQEHPAQLGAHQRALARVDVGDAAPATASVARAHREHRRAQAVAVPGHGVAADVATHAASCGSGGRRDHPGRSACSTAAGAGNAAGHRHLGGRCCPSQAAARLVQAARCDGCPAPARSWPFRGGRGPRGRRAPVTRSSSAGRRSAGGGAAAPSGAPHANRGACGLFCGAGSAGRIRGARSSGGARRCSSGGRWTSTDPDSLGGARGGGGRPRDGVSYAAAHGVRRGVRGGGGAVPRRGRGAGGAAGGGGGGGRRTRRPQSPQAGGQCAGI